MAAPSSNNPSLRNPFRFRWNFNGSEYSIIEVFLKFITGLAIAGFVLFLIIRLSGYGRFQPVEREFMETPATVPDAAPMSAPANAPAPVPAPVAPSPSSGR